jgi:hypothetical protein
MSGDLYARGRTILGRSVWAIVAGYLVFGLSAAVLFGVSGVDPHVTPSLLFVIASISYGVFFAALAGFTAASLAPKNAARHSAILAAIIAAIALLSLALQFRSGSVWSEVATLLLMSPAAVLGGQIRVSKSRRSASAL